MLSDGPITNIYEDKLKRGPLARKLASVIANRKESESYVIGIDGHWGAGKTSFINLMLDNISGESFIIYKFNPWVLSSHETVIKTFIKGLADVISPSLPCYSRSYSVFEKYVSEITSASFSVSGINFTSSKKETTLEKLKKEINIKILKSKKKIVIVIDDLDRLDPVDIKILIKTIKAIADFENTIFLVAYDRKVVAKYLDQPNEGFTGHEYLKKIINVNYYLPQPDDNDIWQMLFSNIDTINTEFFGTDDIDNKRWSEVFHGGLNKSIQTIRDVKLLINSLSTTLPALSIADVNPVDVIAIESIRVFYPEVYGHISGNKEFFLGNTFLSAHRDEGGTQKKLDSLLESVLPERREFLKKILVELFPKLSSGGIGYGGEWQDIWTKEKRVCSQEKFPYYFQFGIPSGSISDAEVEGFTNLLKENVELSEIEGILKNYDSENKLNKFLSKLPGNITGLSQQTTENLLLSLWKFQEEIIFEDRKEEDFLFDLPSRFMRLSYHVLKDNISVDNRLVFLENIIKKTTSLYTPVMVLAILKDEIEKKSESEEILIKPEQLPKLLQIGLDIIKRNKEKFVDYPYGLSMLYKWEQFGDPEGVKLWLEEKTTKKNLLNLLTGFMARGSSSNEGLYYFIQKKDIEHFGILEKIESLFKDLTPEEMTNATPRQKIAINAFNRKERW